MTAARGIDRGFQPGFASRSGAGGLPGLMIAVLAVGSGVVEALCAQLRHDSFGFAYWIANVDAPRRMSVGSAYRSVDMRLIAC